MRNAWFACSANAAAKKAVKSSSFSYANNNFNKESFILHTTLTASQIAKGRLAVLKRCDPLPKGCRMDAESPERSFAW